MGQLGLSFLETSPGPSEATTMKMNRWDRLSGRCDHPLQARARPALKHGVRQETRLMAHSGLREACKLEAEKCFSRKISNSLLRTLEKVMDSSQNPEFCEISRRRKTFQWLKIEIATASKALYSWISMKSGQGGPKVETV